MMESLYIHIPFCEKICTYCDFAKEIDSTDKQDAYINALISEIKIYKAYYDSLQTIFIGGGTPSILSNENIVKLSQALHEYINMDEIREFTMECNPNDLTLAKLKTIQSMGVNRLSLGVQTFNDDHLTFLNRTHRAKDVLKAFEAIKTVSFDSVSVDMLFALPNQTIEQLKEDLRILSTLNVNHVSYYNLILEEKTKLYSLVQKGKVSLLDDELEASMFELIIDTLTIQGFHHYEISNFCKNNHQGLHNVKIWQDGDYLGLGVGAHSKYHHKRFYNKRRIKHYIETLNNDQKPPYETYEYEPIRDYLLNGFRLLQGINVKDYNHRFKEDIFKRYPVFKQLIDEGFLNYKVPYLSLSHKGLMYGNAIFGIL